MPKYSYTALNLENKKVKGEQDARDDFDLRKTLKAKNLVPLKYNEITEKTSSYRMKANEAAELSRQLSEMMGSGITVVRALDILRERDFKPGLKAIYNKLHKDAQMGNTLSESMKMQKRAFPELLINMYASGEAGGQLEQVARKMAVHYEKEHRLNGNVKSAMTYPIILVLISILVMMVLFLFILPEFFKSFEDMELPALTLAVIAISNFLTDSWYILIIAVLTLAAASQYLLRVRKIAIKVDAFKLRIPIVGKLLRIIYTARFARTLSSLYSSGISMLNALTITGTIINNKYIEAQFEELVKNIKNGEPLSESIYKIDGFEKKLGTTILIGEESGRLDAMLESTAESFDHEAEGATGRLVKLIEPVMLVFLAIMIGIIMLSVMLPLMSMYSEVN